jgi:hypothetical protein
MIIVALLIGLILIAAAIRGTQGALFSALGTDLPAYVVWAAALVAVGSLGFVPGLKGPSRALLALVIVVLILNNYQAILAGFAAVSSPTSSTGTAAGNAAPAGAASPPVTQAGAATSTWGAAAASAGANTFGISPSASAWGAALGAAARGTIADVAPGFASPIGGGP